MQIDLGSLSRVSLQQALENTGYLDCIISQVFHVHPTTTNEDVWMYEVEFAEPDGDSHVFSNGKIYVSFDAEKLAIVAEF